MAASSFGFKFLLLLASGAGLSLLLASCLFFRNRRKRPLQQKRPPGPSNKVHADQRPPALEIDLEAGTRGLDNLSLASLPSPPLSSDKKAHSAYLMKNVGLWGRDSGSKLSRANSSKKIHPGHPIEERADLDSATSAGPTSAPLKVVSTAARSLPPSILDQMRTVKPLFVTSSDNLVPQVSLVVPASFLLPKLRFNIHSAILYTQQRVQSEVDNKGNVGGFFCDVKLSQGVVDAGSPEGKRLLRQAVTGSRVLKKEILSVAEQETTPDAAKTKLKATDAAPTSAVNHGPSFVDPGTAEWKMVQETPIFVVFLGGDAFWFEADKRTIYDGMVMFERLLDILSILPSLTNCQRMDIALQVWSGVHALHEQQLFHGSLSTEAVYLDGGPGRYESLKVAPPWAQISAQALRSSTGPDQAASPPKRHVTLHLPVHTQSTNLAQLASDEPDKSSASAPVVRHKTGASSLRALSNLFTPASKRPAAAEGGAQSFREGAQEDVHAFGLIMQRLFSTASEDSDQETETDNVQQIQFIVETLIHSCLGPADHRPASTDIISELKRAREIYKSG